MGALQQNSSVSGLELDGTGTFNASAKKEFVVFGSFFMPRLRTLSKRATGRAAGTRWCPLCTVDKRSAENLEPQRSITSGSVAACRSRYLTWRASKVGAAPSREALVPGIFRYPWLQGVANQLQVNRSTDKQRR